MLDTAERTRGIPEERLQAILESKDTDASLAACTKHGYSESWTLIDGCKHFIDQETGDIAYREPFRVPLKTWVLPTATP